MPETILPLTEEEQEKIVSPLESWDNRMAAKIVKQDFERAEQDVANNHEPRWKNADELYLAWAPQKTWEGTRIPRANIPVFVTFKQVESLLPKFMRTIFGDDPWFEVDPEPGTTMEEARQFRDLVLSQFDRQDSRGVPMGREAYRRAKKSALIRGNGILESGWEYWEGLEKRFVPTYSPKTIRVPHPILGAVRVPTGELKRSVKETKRAIKINQPFLRYVSLRDFRIDPNCESPFVQDARWAAVRRLIAIDELETLREQDGFLIPERTRLLELAKKRIQTSSEVGKQHQDSLRGISSNPREEGSIDPGSQRIEVIDYRTKDRQVWLAEREETLYNEMNDYGIIPFFNVVYTDVQDRFYGLSVSDVTEGDQRLSRSFIEARVDEASLGIHRARIKRRGTSIPAYQLRRRPGQVIEADNPKEDVVTEDVQNISQQFYLEVNAAELRSQQTTGATDLDAFGTPPVAGNAAGRTATGINAQVGASSGRHLYLIENDETGVLEMILNFWRDLNTEFLPPDEPLSFRSARGEMKSLDPLVIKNSRVRFSMRSGARLRARTSLLQGLPLLAQTLLNPQFLALMSQSGKKINIQEVTYMILDALDYKAREELFVEMSPEENQSMNQPPATEMVRMRMQKERITSAETNQETRNMTDLLRELIRQSVAARQKESGRRAQ